MSRGCFDCKAQDAEGKWRKARVVGSRTIDFGTASYPMFRVEFAIGGSRWVRAHEIREGVLS